MYFHLYPYLHLYLYFRVGDGDEGGLIKCRVFRDPDNTSGGQCWSVRYTKLGHECFSSIYLSGYFLYHIGTFCKTLLLHFYLSCFSTSRLAEDVFPLVSRMKIFVDKAAEGLHFVLTY